MKAFLLAAALAAAPTAKAPSPPDPKDVQISDLQQKLVLDEEIIKVLRIQRSHLIEQVAESQLHEQVEIDLQGGKM